MSCPKLNWSLCAVDAPGDEPYVPSLFQMREYCGTESHIKCPLYLGYHLHRHQCHDGAAVC